MKKKTAFTLIELLVVVAIIAVLIAILLPALTKARDSVKTTMCLTNLRTLGQASQVYVQENADTYVKWSLTPQGVPLADIVSWPKYFLQRRYVTSKSFLCPGFNNIYTDTILTMDKLDLPDYLYYLYMTIDYGYNFKNIGSSNNYDGDNFGPPAKLSQIANPTQTIYAVDAIHMNAAVMGNKIHGCAVVDDSYIYLQYTAHARHLSNSRINVLWCDGHATSVGAPVRSGGGRSTTFDEYQRAYLGDLTYFQYSKYPITAENVIANYWDRF